MGQTSYSPPPGGGSGTNYWQVIATVLQPIVAGINSILTNFGFFSMNVTDAVGGFFYNDGAGNSGQSGLEATGAGNEWTTAAGVQAIAKATSAGLVESLVSTPAGASVFNNLNNTDATLGANDGAGNQGLIDITSASLQASVTDVAGDESILNMSSLEADLTVTVAGSSSNLQVVQNGIYLNTTPSGGAIKSLGLAQSRVGIITNQAVLAAGAMPGVTLGTIAVFNNTGGFVGHIQLTA